MFTTCFLSASTQLSKDEDEPTEHQRIHSAHQTPGCFCALLQCRSVKSADHKSSELANLKRLLLMIPFLPFGFNRIMKLGENNIIDLFWLQNLFVLQSPLITRTKSL